MDEAIGGRPSVSPPVLTASSSPDAAAASLPSNGESREEEHAEREERRESERAERGEKREGVTGQRRKKREGENGQRGDQRRGDKRERSVFSN